MAGQSGGLGHGGHNPCREQGVLVDVHDNNAVKAKAVIDSLIDIVGVEGIYSVIPKSGNTFEVVLAHTDLVKVAVGKLKIGKSEFECREIVNQSVVVSFMHVSAFVTDDNIREKLWTEYKVETEGEFQRRKHPELKIYDGTRYVRVKFPPGLKSLPYTMKFYNGESWDYVRVIHNDQQKLCRQCNSPDHTMRDCPDFVCFKCDGQGHMARACKAPRCTECRRFGDKCTCMAMGDNYSVDSYLCEHCGDRYCDCHRPCDKCDNIECVCPGVGDYLCDKCGVRDCTCSDRRDEKVLCDKCGRVECICSSLCDKCMYSSCQCADKPSCYDVDDLPGEVTSDVVPVAGDVANGVGDVAVVTGGDVDADSVGVIIVGVAVDATDVAVSTAGVDAVPGVNAVPGVDAVPGVNAVPGVDAVPDVDDVGDPMFAAGGTPGEPTATDGSANNETDMMCDVDENSSDTNLCEVCGSVECKCMTDSASGKATKRRRKIEVIPNIKCARSSSTKM